MKLVRIRLLVDTTMSESQVPLLADEVGKQGLVKVIINGREIVARLVGAQEVYGDE